MDTFVSELGKDLKSELSNALSSNSVKDNEISNNNKDDNKEDLSESQELSNSPHITESSNSENDSDEDDEFLEIKPITKKVMFDDTVDVHQISSSENIQSNSQICPEPTTQQSLITQQEQVTNLEPIIQKQEPIIITQQDSIPNIIIKSSENINNVPIKKQEEIAMLSEPIIINKQPIQPTLSIMKQTVQPIMKQAQQKNISKTTQHTIQQPKQQPKQQQKKQSFQMSQPIVQNQNIVNNVGFIHDIMSKITTSSYSNKLSLFSIVMIVSGLIFIYKKYTEIKKMDEFDKKTNSSHK